MAARRGKRRPIRQDDLFQVGYVADAVLSPDGRTAAYVLAEARGKGDKEKQLLSIWLVATDGRGKPRRLTRGSGNSYHPRFSPDGGELYFLSSRDKVPQIYVMPLAGGEAEALTELPQGAGRFELSPDGRQLLFVALAAPPAAADINRHQRIDQFWYRFDPIGGYVADVSQAVFLLKRGGKPRAVTEPGGIISAAEFSPDGRRIVMLRTGLPEQKVFETDLSVVELGRKPKEKRLERSLLQTASFGADGRSLICTLFPGDLARQSTLTVVDPKSGKSSDRTRSLDLLVGNAIEAHVPVQIASRVISSEDGRSAYAVITRGGEAHVHRISLTGKKSAEPIGRGESVSYLMARSEGKLLTVRQSFNEPPALFVVEEATGEATQLTHHNKRWSQKFRWPDVERIVVESARNVEIEGWVLKPEHVRPPYKTILVIHGGPHGGFGCSFWTDFHELVGAGYAVAYMNPRGSTGYGEKFARSILGRWGDPELQDFDAFLDRLVDAGIADADRLGVTGISGGGHLSAWLIGHTDRFKAAVPEQGVYSMVSMWGTSDAGRDLLELELGGELHKRPMTYWKQSPIAHAHKARTPTLLLQGETDIRCPAEQAEQMFAALHQHGCPVEYVPMKSCRHGEQVFGRPPLRRFRMNVIRDWFDRHVR